MNPVRRALGMAVAINTSILVGEAVAGFHGNSLALIVDAAHNLSDELALILLFLAYLIAAKASPALQRAANVFNSLGLILISALILWQAISRLSAPPQVAGWLPISVGVLAGLGNALVARVLRPHRERNAAIRLAYLHNLGDVYVSLAPVSAGVLVALTGNPLFDPVIAGGIATWLIYSTAVEIRQSRDELFWPEDADYGGESKAA